MSRSQPEIAGFIRLGPAGGAADGAAASDEGGKTELSS